MPRLKFQEEAFNFVSRWCTSSREFVNRKVERWKLLEDLYHNRRELNHWGARSVLDRTGLGSPRSKDPAARRNQWQSDIVLAPSYIVDTWADRAYQAIFSGPEWLTVIPEALQEGEEDEDSRFPASYKLQELLVTRLAEGRIHVRLYEILQHLVLYGSVYAKIFWYSKGVRTNRWSWETLEVTEDYDRLFDCPVIQVIPLDRLLPDWTADHGDVQRHTGIGHRVDKTYDHVIEQFGRGTYNLNRSKVEERWGTGEAWSREADDGLLRDEDAAGISSPDTPRLTIWEWHGRIPSGDGQRECLCSIVTDAGAPNPEDGVMVRLTEGPVLWSGFRPFLSAHYTPMPGPFGVGAVESNLDLIHAISQFISQSQDNTRLTANAQLIVRRGSSAARQIYSDDDAVYPGKVWMVDDPNDIQPFPALNFPQHEVNHLIDYLNSLLERRTNVSDMTLGVPGGGKTATEAHILQDAALSPFATRTDLFARSFLEPLGRIALCMLQQFLLDDQIITVRDYSGREFPLTVTAQEIHDGRYRVAASLTRRDSSRIARAQSIERVLPTLARFQPILAAEGVRISFTELIKRYLDLIGVEGADRVFSRTGPSENPRDMGLRPSGQGSEAPWDADPPNPLVQSGGPMGSQPTDHNAIAQFLQRQAMNASE